MNHYSHEFVNNQYAEIFNCILKFLNSSELSSKLNLENIKKLSSYVNNFKTI